MKQILFQPIKLVFALALSISINHNSTAQECGSEVPPGHIQHLQKLIQSINAQKGKTMQAESLPVQFIVSRNSSGGNSAFTDTEKTNTMSEINTAYAPMDISFYEYAAPIYIDDDSWNSAFNKSDDGSLPSYEVDDVINVFVFHTVNSGSNSICGYAKFPGTGNRVILNSSCSQNGSTTAHELGHYFSLLHTHSSSNGSELVQRTNCTSAGDLFCDTPADPNISGLVSSSTCTYIGTATDANGDTYTPDPNNVMSYSSKACRTDFSSEQQAAIIASMYADRSYLIEFGNISSFPYQESFEAGLGKWSNSSGDNIDWTRDENGTTSSNTGPSSGSDGSFYMYTESSSNGVGYPSKAAILESPEVDLSNLNNPSLEFDYHMYGSTMGSLEVEVSINGGTSWVSIWNVSGNLGNSWNNAVLSLQSYYGQTILIRFNGTTGSSYTSDMAIDLVKIQESTTICSVGISSFPYSESFESDFGNWNNVSGDDTDWTRDASGTTSSSTGPSAGNDGSYYLYVESSTSGTGFPSKTAKVISDCINLDNVTTPTLEFAYHMYGSSMGDLEVLISNDNGDNWSSLWTASGDLGDVWSQASIGLGAYQGQIVLVQFLGTTGSSYRSDMAIDYVRINDGSSDENVDILSQHSIGENNLSIYPNPTDKPSLSMDVHSNNDAKAELIVSSINGQKVLVQNLDLLQGKNHLELNVRGLSMGMYQVTIVFENENVISSKLLIQQ